MVLFPAALAENELLIGTAAQAAITTAAANAAALLALFVFFIINAPFPLYPFFRYILNFCCDGISPFRIRFSVYSELLDIIVTQVNAFVKEF